MEARIVFFHVLKCGGNSLYKAFFQAYGAIEGGPPRPDLVRLDIHASTKAASLMESRVHNFREGLLAYYLMKSSTNFIGGHFSFSQRIYEAFQDKFAFITVIRDPVERWISQYFYNRYKSSEHHKVELDFDAYLNSNEGMCAGNHLVSVFKGTDCPLNSRSCEAIEIAKQNLAKLNLVGSLKHLDLFESGFLSLFGKKLEIPKENENPAPQNVREAALSEGAMSAIREICLPDQELYDFAISNLIKPAGSSSYLEQLLV